MNARMSTPPAGLFRGNNFMTPRILGYWKVKNGWAELSEGEGISRQPIFGVSVRPDPDHSKSKLCFSRAEALEYIDSLA